MPAKKAVADTKSRYSVHPGFAREGASEANLLKNTGKTLTDWIDLVKKSGPATEEERASWLKTQHKLGTNISAWIAERAAGKKGAEDYDPDALVEAMYSGKKAALRPIYSELLELAFELGGDVRACPCKTIVPLYRKHVFAQIKPTTNSRIDLGLALKSTEAKGRLIDTGGLAKGDRITHRIEVMSVDEIDDELKSWLKKAYEMNA